MAITTRQTRLLGTSNKVEIVCPYCGNAAYYSAVFGAHPFVVLCDADNSNGCDRYFVAKVALFATVTAMGIDDGAAQ